jgi:hypothetical protein
MRFWRREFHNLKETKIMNINKEFLISLIKELVKKRGFFYSEADFQHEIAFAIHKQLNSKVEIQLERPIKVSISGFYIDIIINEGNSKFAVELKYKTRESATHTELKNHSGHGAGRYDFLKDIYRLEKLKKEEEIEKGFAIFLTNDKNYQGGNSKDNARQKNVLLKNRLLSGEICWNGNFDEKKVGKSRMETITLTGKYILNWEKIDDSEFDYLLVEI